MKDFNVTHKLQLEEIVFFWKEVLGLQQWDIQASFRRREDMTIEGAQGEYIACWVGEEAIIHILEPCDFLNTPHTQDVEKTVVHELLHIVLDHYTQDVDGEPEATKLHQAIDRIAKALVTARRLAPGDFEQTATHLLRYEPVAAIHQFG